MITYFGNMSELA